MGSTFESEDQECDLLKQVEEKYHIPAEWVQGLSEVVKFGAQKHGMNNWKYNISDRSSFKGFHDAAFHHLARSFSKGCYYDSLERGDKESNLDELLHLAVNALMCYTKINNGDYTQED